MDKHHLPGCETAGTAFAQGDRVRIRPGVGGGTEAGEEGTVRSAGAAGPRPVRVLLDSDLGDPKAEPRGFEPNELEPAEAADR
jgi:hypothetical protein